MSVSTEIFISVYMKQDIMSAWLRLGFHVSHEDSRVTARICACANAIGKIV